MDEELQEGLSSAERSWRDYCVFIFDQSQYVLAEFPDTRMRFAAKAVFGGQTRMIERTDPDSDWQRRAFCDAWEHYSESGGPE